MPMRQFFYCLQMGNAQKPHILIRTGAEGAKRGPQDSWKMLSNGFEFAQSRRYKRKQIFLQGS
jgi:hypothetical protein